MTVNAWVLTVAHSHREVVALDELVEDRRACCEHREARPEDPLVVVVGLLGVGEALNEPIERPPLHPTRRRF